MVGSGDPLVLVPGTFSDRRTWLKVVGALSPGFRCLLFDPRGTGDTPDPGRPFTPDDLVDDLLALMDTNGFARAHLVGHSLGATVALLAAARHPARVDRVVAAAPALYMDAFLLAVLNQWQALAASNVSPTDLHRALVLLAFGRRAHERLVPAVVREMDARPLGRDTVLRYVECDRGQDLRPFGRRVDAPTLVVVGAEDALTGTEQARSVAAAVPGARLEIVEGSGHSPQVERPTDFVRLVVPFLGR